MIIDTLYANEKRPGEWYAQILLTPNCTHESNWNSVFGVPNFIIIKLILSTCTFVYIFIHFLLIYLVCVYNMCEHGDAYEQA